MVENSFASLINFHFRAIFIQRPSVFISWCVVKASRSVSRFRPEIGSASQAFAEGFMDNHRFCIPSKRHTKCFVPNPSEVFHGTEAFRKDSIPVKAVVATGSAFEPGQEQHLFIASSFLICNLSLAFSMMRLEKSFSLDNSVITPFRSSTTPR